MIKIFNNLFITKIFIFIAWICMWISINSMPGEIGYMNKNLVSFVNGMKTIMAISLSILTIGFTIYLYIQKKIQTHSILLIIFFIHFFSQFIGLIFNNERVIDLNTTYLILYAVGTVCIFHIIDNFKLYKLLPYLIYFIILILFLSLIIITMDSKDIISKIIESRNLYNFLHPDTAINYQDPQRITGFSRTIAVINIFLIILYLKNNKRIYSLGIYFLTFIISCVIWLSQSRGTIICYYSSILFLILFCNNLKILNKLIYVIVLTFFSIISTNLLLNTLSKNNVSETNIVKNGKLEKLEKLETTIVENNKLDEKENKNFLFNNLGLESSRFYKEQHSSGRVQLWEKAIKNFEKKKVFGYGPQADRIILMDLRSVYSNNVSNGVIYSLLSGGYVSFICVIFIYVYSFILFLKFFINEKLYKFSYNLNSNNMIYTCSIIYCIFFMVRALIENSFTLFSIDFLITIISIFIIEKFQKIRGNFI